MLSNADTTVTGPYARAARIYRAAGWHGVLPVGRRAGEKWPPPGGFTGHGNPDPSGADIEAWIETHGDRNVGLRAPVGVLGLDVDAYEKDGKLKNGAAALAELEARWGALPATWVSSARPAPSGIRWFRVPELLDGRPINWPGEAAKGIELIQRGHRYAVAWPSTNPEADGAEYRWADQGARPVGFPWDGVTVPRPDQLTDLPETWVRGLALQYERTDKPDVSTAAAAAWWDLLRPAAAEQPMCARVASTLAEAQAGLLRGESGRHELARDAARTLAAYGGEGHVGAAEALLGLGADFDTATQGRASATGEWTRLLAGAVALAMADNARPRELCTCVVPALSIAPPPPSLAVDPGTGQVVVPAPKPDEPIEATTLTDSRIAQLICDEFLHGSHCWAPGLGWLAWTGQRWRECSEESVIEEVRKWLAVYVAGQVANVFVRADKESFRLLIGLESAYRLAAITRLCRGVLHVEASAFDTAAHLLNTPTGVVDLRTGELLPHDPAMRLTKITGTGYVPGAVHEDWATALSAVREDVAAWLRVRFGQSIIGEMTPDDVMLILQGGGENGKSTILNAIKQAVGAYGVYISDRVLLADPNAHPTEMMDFRGARFALTEELPDEARLNVARMKMVVGTPTIKARYMRQDSITFDAIHSFFLSTNPVPIVTETDHGTWRRLALVRFPFRYRKPHEPLEGPNDRHGDVGLRERLASGERQREAVLAWLVAGAVDWYAHGMPALPASVEADTAEWRANSDPIEGFWRERLRPDPASFITTEDMITAFNDYLKSVGQRGEWSQRRFNGTFAEHSTTRKYRVEFLQARVKEGQVRSYRPLNVPAPQPWVPVTPRVGTKLRAWWGVRFVHGTEFD